jgi:hypothetical protein
MFVFMFDYSQMILEYLHQIKINGDFDGSFHKSLDLEIDLSATLLGHAPTGKWNSILSSI